MHGLDDQSTALVKEHWWIVVVADDAGGVSSACHEGESACLVARVISSPVVSVRTSVFDQHVDCDRGAAFGECHVVELLQGISVHREAEEVKPEILRAEGDAQPAVLRALGQSEAIEKVLRAIHDADVDDQVLAYQ